MFGLTPYRRGGEVSRRNDAGDLRGLFDDFFNDNFFPAFVSSNPMMRADIRETDGGYLIEAEIPGVSKEDIKLDVSDDTLTISVERNEQVNEERENYIRKERRFGSCSRSFRLDNVKQDSISAKYSDGVLKVTLPKSGEARSKGRKIEIQ